MDRKRPAPDLGIWKFINKAHLYFPLDEGVARVFTRLTGTKIKKNWNGVLQITKYFRKINPKDPTKYDFILSRPTILDICKKKPEESDCDACFLNKYCKTGKQIMKYLKTPIVPETKVLLLCELACACF